METTSSFGYWIRRQRKALDLTQQALAERVGCSLSESVRLFIERALATKQNFRLTNENVSFIAKICHRLDGIPLAMKSGPFEGCCLFSARVL
jgi:predicted ATPase